MKILFQHFRQSSSLQLLCKIVITIAVFWLVFHEVDLGGMVEIVRNQNHAILLAVVAVSTIHIYIGPLRWQIILVALLGGKDKALSLFSLIRIYYISLFFNCCMPGAVGGDVVRVWLAKSQEIPLSICVNSVIIDRMMALLALVMVVILTMPMLAATVGFDATPILPVLVTLAIAGLWFLLKADRLLARFNHLSAVQWFLNLLMGIRLILRKPLVFISVLVLAIAMQFVFSLSAWLLAQSLSINMTLLQSITLMPIVLLVTMLPISIGGWGVREVGIIGMLGLIGVPKASALILSLQLGFIAVLVSLPASILWLARRKRYGELTHE
jgi:glycosyltransferase 2 family protein